MLGVGLCRKWVTISPGLYEGLLSETKKTVKGGCFLLCISASAPYPSQDAQKMAGGGWHMYRLTDCNVTARSQNEQTFDGISRLQVGWRRSGSMCPWKVEREWRYQKHCRRVRFGPVSYCVRPGTRSLESQSYLSLGDTRPCCFHRNRFHQARDSQRKAQEVLCMV